MSIVTGVNHLNRVLARSYIVQINNSSAVDHRSSIILAVNINGHITGSIVSNNYDNSTIALVNHPDGGCGIDLIDIEGCGTVAWLVFLASVECYVDCVRTSFQIRNDQCADTA